LPGPGNRRKTEVRSRDHRREHAEHGWHHAGARVAQPRKLQVRATPGVDDRSDYRAQATREGGGGDWLACETLQPREAVGDGRQSARLNFRFFTITYDMRKFQMKSAKRMLAVAAAAYCFSLAAHADCVLPPAPSKIPDGATASE